MMITLLMSRRTLKRSLSGALFLMLGLFIFEFVQPLIADSLGGGVGIAELIERMPPAFQAITRTQPEFVALSGLPGYLSLGLTHPIYFILTTAALAALICRSIAGELEGGIMQLALSRPVSRRAVYASRLIAVAVTILLVTLVALAGMMAGLLYTDPDGRLVYAHLIPTAIAAILLHAAIAGVALAISSASNTTGQAIGWTTGFVVVSFVIDYLAGIWSVIEPIDPISVFAYFDPANSLINGALAWSDALVLIAVALGGTLIGLRIFQERDFPS